MTTDLGIALRNHPEIEEDLRIRNDIQHITPLNECLEDIIVFTYDILSNLLERSTIFGDVV